MKDGRDPQHRSRSTPARWRVAGSDRGWVWRLGLLLVVAGTLSLSIWLWLAWTRPWSPPTEPFGTDEMMVRIAPGTTFQAVADTLQARRLLRHPWLFRLAARLSGQDRRLQAGRYRLSRGTSPRGLLAQLVQGKTLPVRVTVPEGLEADQIAALVADSLGFVAGDFLSAADSLARAGAIARRFLGTQHPVAAFDSLLSVSAAIPGRRLRWSEGYLAPDTYHFAEGVSATQAAQAIVGLGLARLDSIRRRASVAITSLALTPHQLLTLASIVEAEARLPGERPRIAAVYVNRLRRSWRLEADPCVAYFLGKRGQRLYYKDLRVPSPYNTYRQPGLPPGPIGNPGLSALAAAARPDSSCDALFFVSDGERGHVFSRTRAEHEAAVRSFRQRRTDATR